MPDTIRIYVGTYTGPGKSEGIYIYRMDLKSGRLKYESKTTGQENPSFLALDPKHRCLYAINEIGEFQGKPTGSVSAFAVHPDTGELTLLNQQSSHGRGPCHVSVDATGQCVFAANYGEGSIAALPVRADGSLGEATTAIQHTGTSINPTRQNQPHAHMIIPSPDNRYVFAPDLGIDKIMIYTLDPAKGALTSHDPPWAQIKAGGGPRHFVFHPDGRRAYLLHEMGNAISVFTYDAENGVLNEIQMIDTLPDDFNGVNHTADIHITPSGKFLYCSNRGHDSLALFAISGDGQLTALGYASTRGENPRNFAIDPTGTYLLAANQDTDTVATFRIDQKTGGLTEVGIVGIPTPVCLQMVAIR